MKKSNIILSIVLAAVLVVCLSSCYVAAFAPFLGTYSYSYSTKFIKYNISYTFNNDDSVKYLVKGAYLWDNSSISPISSTGTYKYDSNSIEMTFDGTTTATSYEMSDWNKTLKLGDNTLTKEE